MGKKILIDDSLITGGRLPAMKDPYWHKVEDRFEFDFEDKKVSVFNEDVYWVNQNEIIEILKKHSRLLSIAGAYATVGNGIVVVNNGKKNNIIQIQVHAY